MGDLTTTRPVANYLLDTTVLIDYLRGQQPAVLLLHRLAAEGHALQVTCVQVAELFSGLREEDRPRVEAFLESLQYLPISLDVAKQAGQYRLAFARQGRTLPLPDLLVAAAAQAEGATLITSNIRHFSVLGLSLLDYRR